MFTQDYVDKFTALPELDDEFSYLIEWINELGFLESNGMGVNVIGYQTIKAWADLMQVYPTPFDVKILREMSSAFIAMQEKAKKTNEPDPLKELRHD